MTALHGVGFLAIGLLGIVIGGFVAWYIINKVEEDDEKKIIVIDTQRPYVKWSRDKDIMY